MYLTKIELDSKKQKTLLALRNPNLIHGAIASNYPEEKILWRIDKVGNKTNLLLQSTEPLTFTPIVKQFGKKEAINVDLSSVLNLIKEGSKWRFRIKANTVHKVIRQKTGKPGYVHYMNDKDRLSWIMKRADNRGFGIDSCSIREIENIRFKRGEKLVSFGATTFEGVLTVTDAKKFLLTLESGMGHGKAYGLGMFSIAPL